MNIHPLAMNILLAFVPATGAGRISRPLENAVELASVF
jgi:hypothetical protein